MKELFPDILSRIPDYQTFLTPDELDQSSRELAALYPGRVRLLTIGKTKNGRDLLCLKIGEGSRNSLLFGCPHPNEPIGTMMLEYFSRELAENEALLEAADYTWYIVKAWDRDGLEKNEGWLKGPFDIYHYSRYFFRPAGHQQVDWTFPIDYKNYHFDNILPESQAMKDLIDEIRPEFIYSLHNAGFGGVYWYVTHPLEEETYAAMRKAADKNEVPLNLGEPEVPYLKMLAPAVYPCLSIRADYDYLETYSGKDPAEHMFCGDCSAAYAQDRYDSFTLLTELPYFFDPRIADLSESERTRRDVMLERIEASEAQSAYIRSILKKTEGLTAKTSQFRMALEAFSREDLEDGTRGIIEKDPDFARKATVAEVFDSLILSPFYKSLSYGMAIRLCEEALDKKDKTEDERKLLSSIRSEADQEHRKLCEKLEASLNYEVVPIRRLIAIQLECGLQVIDELRRKRG